MTTKRAAIYARVSTAEQVDGTSLNTQAERCGHYIAAQRWTVVGSYVDEGVSGAKAHRPALDRLTAEMRAGHLDTVVVAKLDRIGRSMRHLAALLGELDDRGVGLVSVSEAFDSSTASGRLQRNMLGSFAEFERELIRDRMVAGRDATVRSGKWATTHAPYGYRSLAPDNRLEIDPGEAEVLGVMIDLLVNHRSSTAAIARELNARGLRPRQAGPWTTGKVRHILTSNEHLSGNFVWRRPGRGYQGAPIPVSGPALVDPATHERLRARVAATAIAHTLHPGRYLLSGRITSPHGTPMYGYCTNTPMYRCSETFPATAPPGGRTCVCRTVRVEHVETAVWVEVTALLSDPARLRAMAGLHLDREDDTYSSSGADLTAMDRRIDRLEHAAGDKLSHLLGDGLDPAVAAHAARALTDQLSAARARRERLVEWQADNLERHSRGQRLLEVVEQAKQIVPDADRATRARVLALLDVTVQVDGWDKCLTCAGTGWVSKWAPGQVPRIKDTGIRQFAGVVCPGCQRQRFLPRLTIEGTVPEADLSADHASDAPERWPFKVVSGTG